MHDEELRALERAAKTGDHAARLKLGDWRARTVSASVLDDFVCGRAEALALGFEGSVSERVVSEFDRRAVFFIANATNALADQRRRVATWAASVCYGRLVAMIVMTHGLAVFGIAEGESTNFMLRGEPYVHYSPRREPSWGFVHAAWREIPKRRPSAAEARSALEAWALTRSDDRLVVTPVVASEWALFARDRYGAESGEQSEEERETEDDLEAIDPCGCEFGTCHGTRYLHCLGCGGDLCVCVCGGESECYGCEDCRHEESDEDDDGWDPRDEEDRLAGLPEPIPADQPEQRTGGSS